MENEEKTVNVPLTKQDIIVILNGVNGVGWKPESFEAVAKLVRKMQITHDTFEDILAVKEKADAKD